MLTRFKVHGFKSLVDVEVELPPVMVLFGTNAAGKSNFLDAVHVLSRIAATRTVKEAFESGIRGHPVEAFNFPEGGLAALHGQDSASLSLEADLAVANDMYRYRVEIGIQPASGSLSVRDEYLVALGKNGNPKGTASIEQVNGVLRIRRKSKAAHPRTESPGQNHAMLSDLRLGSTEYRAIERCRGELSGWRTYYLDPRVAMRSAKPPSEVNDIGALGEDIAPFLYRLQKEDPKRFSAVRRTLCSLIPSVRDLTVDLDKKRGTLDIGVTHGGTEFSSRVISEGTLRVLALCAIAVNPWGGELLAFEEPENGVHPRRIELVAKLLTSMATGERKKQIIVTTHSPLLCDAMLSERESRPDTIELFNVRGASNASSIARLRTLGPFFQNKEIDDGFSSTTEDGAFSGAMMRGFIDE